MTIRYTLPEAAAKLRKGTRWLRDWLRNHPGDACGPFCARCGPISRPPWQHTGRRRRHPKGRMQAPGKPAAATMAGCGPGARAAV